jgi:hypothetical protein
MVAQGLQATSGELPEGTSPKLKTRQKSEMASARPPEQAPWWTHQGQTRALRTAKTQGLKHKWRNRDETKT